MKLEPPDPSENQDPLEALLRDADEYTPDNGFTARVVQQLPARRHGNWRRQAVLAAALLLGVGLAAWQSPALYAMVCGALQRPALPHWQSVLVVMPILAAFASLVWVVLALANEED
jgi:hypothetical protein